MDKYVIGVDLEPTQFVFGHVQAKEASTVSYYKRWAPGLYCDPANNQFRQHLDYIESLECITPAQLPKVADHVGNKIDQRITPCAVDETGTPCTAARIQ